MAIGSEGPPSFNVAMLEKVVDKMKTPGPNLSPRSLCWPDSCSSWTGLVVLLFRRRRGRMIDCPAFCYCPATTR
eukprot:9914719-Prorocentrum_lima.AAC.1